MTENNVKDSSKHYFICNTWSSKSADTAKTSSNFKKQIHKTILDNMKSEQRKKSKRM